MTLLSRNIYSLAICWLLSLVATTTIVQGQSNSAIRTLTVADGLPNNNVNCVLEDHEGFLWVGTDHGLARFDGNEFKVLQNIGTDSNNLADQKVIALGQSNDHQLLIGTLSGIHILSADRRTLSSIDTEELEEEDRLAETVLFTEKNAVVWANRQGIFIHSDAKLKAIPYSQLDTSEFNLFADVRLHLLDGDRFLVTTGKTNVYELNARGELLGKFKTHSSFDAIGFSPKSNTLFSLGPLRTTEKNSIVLEQYDLQGSLLQSRIIDSHTPDGQWLTRMASDDQGHFWVSSNQGSFFIDVSDLEQDIQIKSYEEGPRGNPVLRQAVGMEVDANRNCWVATSTGLMWVNTRVKGFQALRPSFVSEDGVFSTRLLHPIKEGQLLVSSYHGQYLLNETTSSFKVLEVNDRGIDENGLFSMYDQLQLADGRSMISCDLNGLLFIELVGEQLRFKAAKADSLVAFFATNLVAGQQGKIWVGSYHGIFEYLPETMELKVPEPLDSLDNQQLKKVLGLYYDHASSTLWGASEEGLVEYEEGQSGYTIHNLKMASSPLGGKAILCLQADEDILWLGTRGSGLVKFNTRTKEIKHFSTANGLSNNTVFSILAGPENTLWLGTANGLSCFSRETERFQNYYTDDGIAHNEFNINSSCALANGTFYMGGLNGITRFRPSDILDEEDRNSVRLSGLTKHNGKSNSDENIVFDIRQVEKLEIHSRDRYFIVHYSQSDLQAREAKYEYQLEGLSDRWHYVGEQSSLRFSGLEPGEYTLRVRKAGRLSVLEDDLALPIVVYAAWYKTGWAYLLFASILAGLAFTFIRFRLNQLKIRNQLKFEQMQMEKREELDRAKSMLFANVSHELRTPLTLILGPLQAAVDGQYWKDEEKILQVLQRAQRNGEHLLRLIEQILDLSRLETGKMVLNEHTVSLESLCKKIHGTFSPLATTKELDWKLVYELDSSRMILLDEDKFEKIIYNLLSNAFKFSPPGSRVSLIVREGRQGFIEFEVQDQGKGIPSEDLPRVFDRFFQSTKMDESHTGGSGIGLAFAKELSHLLGGDISVQSTFGNGASFTLSLPDRTASDFNPKPTGLLADTEAETDLTPRPLSTDHRILIVEDNVDMRAFLKEELEQSFKVVTAVDGLDALERLKANTENIDFIVSDVMMPRMDGFSLLEKVKSDDRLRKIPMVLLTAKSAVEHRVKALRIGVDDYITKPFSTTELKVRISNLLENYQQRQLTVANEPESESNGTFDTHWLEKVESLCNKNVGNNAFGVKDLADAMALSDRQLTRRLKELTGMTPNKYFRAIKLHHARKMVERGQYKTLSELSYQVGFDDPQYFSKLYKSTFGKSPVEVN